MSAAQRRVSKTTSGLQLAPLTSHRSGHETSSRRAPASQRGPSTPSSKGRSPSRRDTSRPAHTRPGAPHGQNGPKSAGKPRSTLASSSKHDGPRTMSKDELTSAEAVLDVSARGDFARGAKKDADESGAARSVQLAGSTEPVGGGRRRRRSGINASRAASRAGAHPRPFVATRHTSRRRRRRGRRSRSRRRGRRCLPA